MCRGRGMPVPATITEQTKILRSINKAHGKSFVYRVINQYPVDQKLMVS